MLIVVLALTANSWAEPNEKIIYGDDNRNDVAMVTNPVWVKLAQSTAAMISVSEIQGDKKITFPKKGGGGGNQSIIVNGPSLESQGICSTERFAKQPTAAFCSGFLVSDRWLVTAGHCVQTEADCANFQWAFDYKAESENQSSVSLKKTNIYHCKRIIEQELSDETSEDYSLIELDRPVVDRTPLKFRTQGKIELNTPILVMGHPSGLPTKIADGAHVRTLEERYFVGNLDTYGGNSGSAVFNANTLEVEGILVRGDEDYVPGPDNCQVSNIVANDGGSGEDVTYITNIKALQSLR
jgi:V8-like Glu-specific endopeptidase